MRLPLGIDPLLRGMRKRVIERGAGAGGAAGGARVERLEITISNTGGQPREVWIEEPLRPARRRAISADPRSSATRAGSIQPEIAGDVARAKVVVDPGQTARLGFTVRYAL